MGSANPDLQLVTGLLSHSGTGSYGEHRAERKFHPGRVRCRGEERQGPAPHRFPSSEDDSTVSLLHPGPRWTAGHHSASACGCRVRLDQDSQGLAMGPLASWALLTGPYPWFSECCAAQQRQHLRTGQQWKFSGQSPTSWTTMARSRAQQSVL